MIIGLHGKMHSGKSTSYNIIRSKVPYVVLVKLAEPLYAIQEFAYKQIESVYKRPESFVKDRKLLQWIGTEWGREINHNMWVEIMLAKAKQYSEEGCLVVVDDVRYDNEAEAIKSVGGVIIEIKRNIDDPTKQHTDHTSEQGVSPNLIDFSVDNSYSLVELKENLTKVLNSPALVEIINRTVKKEGPNGF